MERKIALKFENAFVKAQFFKLFAKIIVRVGLTIICPPPFSAYDTDTDISSHTENLSLRFKKN